MSAMRPEAARRRRPPWLRWPICSAASSRSTANTRSTRGIHRRGPRRAQNNTEVVLTDGARSFGAGVRNIGAESLFEFAFQPSRLGGGLDFEMREKGDEAALGVR